MSTEAEEGVRSPGVGVTGSFEPPDMGVVNLTQVPWKSSACFQSLSQLPSCQKRYFLKPRFFIDKYWIFLDFNFAFNLPSDVVYVHQIQGCLKVGELAQWLSCFFCRGPKFSSQDLCWESLQLPIILDPGHSTLSSGLCRPPSLCKRHTETHKQK